MPSFVDDLDRSHNLRLFSVLADGKCIWEWDIPSDRFSCDPVFERDFGERNDPSQTVLEWWLERVEPLDRGRIRALFESGLKGGGDTWSAEYCFRRLDGSYETVTDRAYIERDADGRARRITHALQVDPDLLSASEREFRSLFESSAVGMSVVDPQTRKFVRVNPKLCEITGYSAAELSQLTFSDITHPDDRSSDLNSYETLLHVTGGRYDCEKRYIRKDGGIRWVRVSGTLVRDAEGRPFRTFGVIRDITREKQATEELAQVSQRLQLAIEAGGLGPWEIDLPEGIINIPERSRAIFGFAESEFRFQDWLKRVHVHDRERIAGFLQRALGGLREIETEYRTIPELGERWIYVRGRTMIGEDGQPIRIVGVAQDITQLKRAEEEKDLIAAGQRREREFLQKLISNAPVAIGVTEGPEHRFVLANEALLGAAETLPVVGRTAAEVFPSLGGQWERELCWKSQKTVFLNEHFLPRHDQSGAAYWNVAFVPLSMPEGSESILSIGQNVTETVRARQLAEQAAAEAEHRALESEEGRRILEAIMEYIPEGIIVADADVQTRIVSRRAALGAGKSREFLECVEAEQLAESWGMLHLDGKTLPSTDELPLVRAARNGEVIEDEEWILVDAEGKRHWVSVNAGPLRDRENQITGGVASWRDITERKQIEERLRQTQRLESIGMLAGGIAHDFNNLLVGVIGYTSLALESLRPDDRIAEYLGQVIKAGEQAAHLTRQMLAYAGRGRFIIERINLSDSVREVQMLLQPTMSKKIELRLELEQDLPSIEADPSQVHQVLMNLVTNAAEAIGDAGGLILVRTLVQELHEDAIRPGKYVCLEVRDTGCGMDAETCSKAFDPFFTTKFTGRGLGLAAVAGIMRGHKGSIRISSEPGKGSSFLAAFPVAMESIPEIKPEEPKDEDLRGSGTLLVVDDEPVVCQLVQHALTQYGYEVLATSDGCSALRLFEADPARFSLVLLDLNMPGMNGLETLVALRKIRPEVKVLISSGYTETETLRLFQGVRIGGFIQKPYGIDDLARKVKAARCAV